MEEFLNIFKLTTPNHVLMFTKLFCITLGIQVLINFAPQFRYFKSQPGRIYGKPIKLLGKFQLPALSENQFIFFGISLTTSLIFTAIGVYPHLFLFIAFICYFPYFNSIISLAYIQRKTNLLPLVLFILAVSPSLKQTLGGPATTWEIVLIKIAIAQMYFSSGIQKLKHSGLSWCNGKSLQAYLLQNHLWSDRKSGYLLAQKLGLCAILSCLTIAFELSFGIIIFFPQLTFFYIAMALFFHFGIYSAMQINYLKYLGPVYLVFFTGIAFWIKDNL